MKKIGHKFIEVCSVENIEKAGIKAARDKGDHLDVIFYKKNRQRLNEQLHQQLLNKEYSVSEEDYRIFKKQTASGKEREIHKLSFYPYRVAQHSVLRVMQDRWMKSLTSDVYNCLPGHGINSKELNHSFAHKLKRALQDRYSVYAFKGDIKKFYPSVDNKKYGHEYRHELKDKDLIWLLDQHNFSNKGLPIGSPDAQMASHLVLRKMDRFIKEELKARYYFRYADDILILGDSKEELHGWMWRIRNFMYYNMKLEMKGDRRVFPVSKGIDVCGFVFFPTHTRLRKRTKKAMILKIHKPKSMASYMGILQHCDSKNLIEKVINQDNRHMKISDFDIKIERPFDGELIKIDKLVDEEIDIIDFDVRESVKNSGHLWVRMQITYNGKRRFVKGGYDYIAQFLLKMQNTFMPVQESEDDVKLTVKQMEEIKSKYLPLENVIIRNNRGYYFEGTLKLN